MKFENFKKITSGRSIMSKKKLLVETPNTYHIDRYVVAVLSQCLFLVFVSLVKSFVKSQKITKKLVRVGTRGTFFVNFRYKKQRRVFTHYFAINIKDGQSRHLFSWHQNHGFVKWFFGST